MTALTSHSFTASIKRATRWQSCILSSLSASADVTATATATSTGMGGYTGTSGRAGTSRSISTNTSRRGCNYPYGGGPVRSAQTMQPPMVTMTTTMTTMTTMATTMTTTMTTMMAKRTMAGHNKWSKIRHKKGKNDANRAKHLGKASKAIIVASKACNGDETDMRLQSAIAQAKAIQLPKDRIHDAILKGRGGTSAAEDLHSVRYDAMVPLDGVRVACIVTALTDNKNRTMPKVRTIISKLGGELLQTNTNDYVFHHVGQMLVPHVDDEDDFMLTALEAGAINVEPASVDNDDNDDNDTDQAENASTAIASTYVVTTEDTELFHVVKALRDDHGYEVTDFEHSYILQDPEHGGVQLSEAGVAELDAFLDKLDDNEDVANVYHNVDN